MRWDARGGLAFYGIPQCGYRHWPLGQLNGEPCATRRSVKHTAAGTAGRLALTVDLVVLLHEKEGIIVEVAMEVDVWPAWRQREGEAETMSLRTLRASTTCMVASEDACRRTGDEGSIVGTGVTKRILTPELNLHILRYLRRPLNITLDASR